MDTGEDDDVQHDTSPMSVPIRLWSRWRPSLIATVRDCEIWFVHDGGDIRIPARSAKHAVQLADAMMLAEFANALPASTGWLRALRRLLLRAIAWTNRRDLRWNQEE